MHCQQNIVCFLKGEINYWSLPRIKPRSLGYPVRNLRYCTDCAVCDWSFKSCWFSFNVVGVMRLNEWKRAVADCNVLRLECNEWRVGCLGKHITNVIQCNFNLAYLVSAGIARATLYTLVGSCSFVCHCCCVCIGTDCDIIHFYELSLRYKWVQNIYFNIWCRPT
jgi:hypothetical protein